ncbi:roadblock/LC7 domain-containing protein [Pseudoxanthomonas sp.]|uniref:roadblock/LC7 domain-containing protein n=1 Tax=Pseudoxanthomonas sp. TaxID=1871049 RepID=UPI002602469E|nr:roadblock/LC7 domain-containing protein [Pseudoxanthomonas sp.]WDS35224.1 MAG: roadblock/LC7 domain-containing protein [Pseudoxanthomonas sp.]
MIDGLPAQQRDLVQAHLQAFASEVGGVRSAVVASVDGFAIAVANGAPGSGERLAAMTSSMLALAAAVGRELALGELESLMAEASAGKVLMLAIPAPVPLLLMAACERRILTGNVLWAARACSRRIADDLRGT